MVLASGTNTDWPILNRLLGDAREGDVGVIWKLDRLSRSLAHFVATVNALSVRGIGLKSLHDPIDTTTPQGRLVFNMFASLVEFERDHVRDAHKPA